MKKVFVLLVTVAMVFMLTSCEAARQPSKSPDTLNTSSDQVSPENALKSMYTSLEKLCLSDVESADFDRYFDEYYNSAFYRVFNSSESKDDFKTQMKESVSEAAYSTVTFTPTIKEQRAASQEELSDSINDLKENGVDVSNVTEAYIVVYDLAAVYGNEEEGISHDNDEDISSVILKRDGKWYCDYDYIALITLSFSD